MAQPNWLNENRHRAFPFLVNTCGDSSVTDSLLGLPDSVIVDAGFIFSNAEYEAGVTLVWLQQIERIGDTFIFAFANSTATSSLYFTRRLSDPDYVSEYAGLGDTTDSDGISDSDSDSISSAAAVNSDWYGYLTTGSMADLAAFLPTDGVISRSTSPTSCIVELALVQNTAGTIVTSINLANDDRTRFTPTEDCISESAPVPLTEPIVVAEGLTGAIVMTYGYGLVVQQDSSINALIFSASPGGGMGFPCAEVPIYPGEPLGEDSTLYEGGPNCNEVLRTINGKGGPKLVISAGDGVTITPTPGSNLLLIDLNMSGLITCYSETV